MGHYAEAESQFKAALKAAEEFGPQDPRLALDLYKLAEVYRAEGKYAAAEPLQQRSLAIRETSLGPEHPDVAASLDGLALLYQAQHRYADAEALYQRSLAISRKALGTEHPNVAVQLNNLATLYRDQGKTDTAEQLFKRSLSILEKASGSQQSNVRVVSGNLGQLYFDHGSYSGAVPLLWRGLDRTAQTVLEFAVFLVLFFIVLAVAFVLNWKLVAREPSARPFRWGYFFAIYDCGIISAALVADRVMNTAPQIVPSK